MTAEPPEESPAPDVARSRRRWWQFRLRTVLVISLLLALTLGWQVNRASRQRRAVAAIRDLGGHVYYSHDIGGREAERNPVGRATQWIGERFGRDLVDRVTWVDIEGVAVRDDDLVWIAAIPSLELLRIDGSEITAEGLEHFAALDRLEVLSLPNHRHLANGLVHLEGLGRLRSIVLSNTDTGDEHAAVLVRIKSLENIDLDDSEVTDAALETLAQLPRLTNLLVGGTHVTDAGVARFREAHPTVRIED
ncbi:MAG: hypothetical protein R3C10_21220 [Pirellulales bacterium]